MHTTKLLLNFFISNFFGKMSIILFKHVQRKVEGKRRLKLNMAFAFKNKMLLLAVPALVSKVILSLKKKHLFFCKCHQT
jgi:hypothetical protein